MSDGEPLIAPPGAWFGPVLAMADSSRERKHKRDLETARQERKRELDAIRQRRQRQRDGRGEIVVQFVAADEFISWSIETGRVDEGRAWDRAALAKVLRLIVAEVMGASRVTDGFSEAAVKHRDDEVSPTRRQTDARKALSDK